MPPRPASLLCLAALLLGLAAAAQAETLWRGDFSGDWMRHWNVTSIGKLGARMETREEAGLGTVLRVTFPPGEVKEGYSFRADLTPLIGHRERLWLSYRVRFSEGFDWQRGGKLPGLMTRHHGSISGCEQPDGTGGFSARFVWQRGGRVALYPYVPPQPGFEPSPRGCARARLLDGRIEPGRWVRLAQMVELNAPGEADGRLRAWIDGEPALALDGVRFRDRPFGIQGILFATFYGGRCCAPEEPGHHVEFADFAVHDAAPPGLGAFP